MNQRFGAQLPVHALFEADASAFEGHPKPEELIEELLRVHRYVRIPALPTSIVLTRPIRIESDTHLSIDERVVLRMADGCGGCMLRNARVASGAERPISGDLPRDADIVVEGGQWVEASGGVGPNDEDPAMRSFGQKKLLTGALFFCHAERVTVRNVLIRRGSVYGVLLSDCRDFLVEDVKFDHHGKDGIHVNGPALHGLIQRVEGQCADDFAALNAWDWETSAVSFGAIRDVTIRHMTCARNEIRILPGRKTYPDGTQVDCPVEDCAFSDISGVYCFKMYQQPNCHNLWRERPDFSDIPGLIRNVAFSNIRLLAPVTDGLGEIRPNALFEMGADCENIRFEHIDLDFTTGLMREADMTVAAIGPKSSTWKRGNPDPAQWAELFQPDMICTADGIVFRDVRFADRRCVERSLLIRALHLSVNPDYPKTTPRGGTGYGIVREVRIEE